MAPKSKLILIMVGLSLGKKRICALALLVMLDKVENEDIGRRKIFWVRKIFQERKKYGLYHILTAELRLFDKEYFFRFVRLTPQRFEHLLSLVGPHLQLTTTKMREPISSAERLVLTMRFLASGEY